MANHLTPAEIADLVGLSEKEVLRLCFEHAVPVWHGRIDKTLFAAACQVSLQAEAERGVDGRAP
jgi:hypothetical protein